MAKVGFLLSTGRTSTQNIGSIAARSHPTAIIEHEGLGPNYYSRRVFRRPKAFAAALGTNIAMQRKLIEIEDALAVGISYLDVGWPAFAWLPYLSKRFAGSFAFAHLVRNPFQVAASLTTHGLFSPTIRNGRQFERRSMIHTSDPILYNHEIAKEGMEFSPFERNLFHWLELNQYLLEQHDKEGFLGLFRFEELYEEGPNDIKKLLDGFLGEAKYDLSTPPVDNIQRTLPEKIASPNSKLVAAVFELATSLGYSEHELRASADLDALNKRYASTRKPGSN